MNGRATSVSSPRWHDRVYPAMNPEQTKDMIHRLQRKNDQIEKLQGACDDLGLQVHDLSTRNYYLQEQLSAVLGALDEERRARQAFMGIVKERNGFITPQAPAMDEYGFLVPQELFPNAQ